MSELSENANPLAPLVGEECDQIHFWADRIEVGFSQWDWWLACTGTPAVHRGDSVVRFPEAGSRDAICSLINSKTEIAAVDENGDAGIRFSNGARLVVERGGWQVKRYQLHTEGGS